MTMPETNAALTRSLFDAIVRHDAPAIRALLAQGADPNAEQPGETALMYAAGVSTAEIVRLLLEHGAGKNKPLPLIEAACGGDVETARLFLDLGADVNAPDEQGWTPLMEAATWGYAEIVRLLLARGAQVNQTMNGLPTALAVAERDGHPEVAAILRQAGPSNHR